MRFQKRQEEISHIALSRLASQPRRVCGAVRRVEVRRGPGHAYAYPGWTGLDWVE